MSMNYKILNSNAKIAQMDVILEKFIETLLIMKINAIMN